MTAPPQFRTPDQGPVLPEGEVARGFDFEAANPNVNPRPCDLTRDLPPWVAGGLVLARPLLWVSRS
jgi:hypothetical protein